MTYSPCVGCDGSSDAILPRITTAERGKEKTRLDTGDATEVAHFTDMRGIGRGLSCLPAGHRALWDLQLLGQLGLRQADDATKLANPAVIEGHTIAPLLLL